MHSITRFCAMTFVALMLGIVFSSTHSASAQALIISEYRLRGPGLTQGTNSSSDEFVELYNNSDVALTVAAADGSAGYALVASDGVARFVVPNGTVIPARGHYLGANSVGYSLGNMANPDIVWTLDIPDTSGIALFNTANPVNFTIANRLDAVGYNVPNPLYREVTGFDPNAINEGTAVLQYSFYRDLRNGLPQDTNNNIADFLGVETFVFTTSAGKRLGSPGPENLASPIQRNATINASLVDPTVASSSPQNRVRDTTPFTYVDPTTGNQFIFPNGTLSIRRSFTNNTGQPVTRLRFRIIDTTTGPTQVGSGVADLRALSSSDVAVILADGSSLTVRGTRLEQPPQQLRGGGWNSAMSADTISLSQPLASGASIPVQFLLGVQQGGSFRFFVNVEALP